MKKITIGTFLILFGVLTSFGQSAWIHSYIKVKTHWDPSQIQLEFYTCVKSDAATNGTAFSVTNVVSQLTIGGSNQTYALNSEGTFSIPSGVSSFTFTATNPVTGNVYTYDANIDPDFVNPSITYNTTPSAPNATPFSMLITTTATTAACEGEIDLNISGGYPYTSSTDPYGTSWYVANSLVPAYHLDSIDNLCAGPVQFRFGDDWECGGSSSSCITIDTFYTYVDTVTLDTVFLDVMYPYISSSYLVSSTVDTLYNTCSGFSCATSFFCEEVVIDLFECPNMIVYPLSCYDFSVDFMPSYGTASANGVTVDPINPIMTTLYGSYTSLPVTFTHITGVSTTCMAYFDVLFNPMIILNNTASICDSNNGSFVFAPGTEEVFSNTYNGPTVFTQNSEITNSANAVVWDTIYDPSDFSFGNDSIVVTDLAPGVYTYSEFNSCGYSQQYTFTILNDTSNCDNSTCYSGYVVCNDSGEGIDNAPVNIYGLSSPTIVYTDSTGFFSYCNDSIDVENITAVVDCGWLNSNGYTAVNSTVVIPILSETASLADANQYEITVNCGSTTYCYSGVVLCTNTSEGINNVPVTISGLDSTVVVYTDSTGLFSYCSNSSLVANVTAVIDYNWVSSMGYAVVNASVVIPGAAESSSISTANQYLIEIECISNGIKTNRSNSINLYPNPTANYFSISSSENVNEVTVYDYNGRLLLTIQPNSLNCNVDLSSFEAGYYQVIVLTNSTRTVKRVIKK